MLPQPSEKQGQIDLNLNTVEKNTGGFSAGGGLSASSLTRGALSGIVGSFDYNQRNLFRQNHRLSAKLELSQMETLFRIQHTDPWIKNDPYRYSFTARHSTQLIQVKMIASCSVGLSSRTSRTVSFQNTRAGGSLVFTPLPTSNDATRNSANGLNRQPSTNQLPDASGNNFETRQVRSDLRSEFGSGFSTCRLVGSIDWKRPVTPKWGLTWGLSWQVMRYTFDYSMEFDQCIVLEKGRG